jgi:SAM-dependent methyltransferase
MKSICCKICSNDNGNKTLKIREMYFGTREVFDYLECSNCGCLQLLNPPKDYSVHYPKNYFTFNQEHESKLKSLLNRFRDRASMGEKSLLGNLLLKKFGSPVYVERMKIAGVALNDSILDVGCGQGILLHKMKESGFENVIGIDPFIDETIPYKNGLIILKKDFSDMDGLYDLVMYNHSFEHMENPFEVMKKSNELLKLNKTLLIRIPVADSFAFNQYKENWCSLDAPRHLYLHTKKSIEILAKSSGFEIKKINYDSRSWQLWGSEQYSKNISLMDERSYYINPKKSIFTEKNIDEFEKKTIELNKNGEGDQTEFYLQKISEIT